MKTAQRKPKIEQTNTPDIFEFIKKYEGYRSCAYFDSKQWSIGYGTKSYKGECITELEAKKRKEAYIKPLLELVNNGCYTDNQKTAIISYIYNTGGYQLNLREHIKNCRYKDIKYVMSVWGYNNKGLKNRRQVEIKLFNS